MDSQNFKLVIDAIDKINSQDPNLEFENGKEVAKELLYSQRMTDCLNKYWPDASECLKIAVHAQHVKRWHLKRRDFEEGRSGYMLWRKELGKLHADIAHEIMLSNDYSSEDADKTASILRKEKLKSNPDSQTLEDVACLVFLQHYFENFAAKHEEDKLISIVQKTWRKMSVRGHEIALELTLPEHLQPVVTKALS